MSPQAIILRLLQREVFMLLAPLFISAAGVISIPRRFAALTTAQLFGTEPMEMTS